MVTFNNFYYFLMEKKKAFFLVDSLYSLTLDFFREY